MNGYIYTAAVLSGTAFVVLLVFTIRRYLSRLVDKRIAAYQSDLLQKHYDEVQNIYRRMRGWRHDYHNHIQVMKAHLFSGESEKLDNYLSELDADLTAVDTIIKTGNIMLDAILNSKLSLASTKKITIDATAGAPKKMNVSDIDLCVIIGNLLDNAAEACSRVVDENKRFIRIYIGMFKGQLYISISNSTAGEIKKTGGRYFSTKDETHGFGLMRIDRIVEKYGGFVNRQNEEGVFATEIMLPL